MTTGLIAAILGLIALGAYVAFLRQGLSERKRAEAGQAGQKRLLELMAQGAPLDEVLEALLYAIESQSGGGLLGSILLLDESGAHLRHGAAPSLPAAYNAAIDGVAIGPDVGSCGTAAFLRQPVHVSDIANDPRWINYKDLALTHGLRACWSTPVYSSAGELLGTFAMYYREARKPPDNDLLLVETVTRTASIAIQRERTRKALRDSEHNFRLLFEQAVDGIFVADASGRYVDANAAACEMVGFTRDELLTMTIVDLIAPEEIPRVPAEVARLAGGQVATSEWRLRRKDGSIFIGELVSRQLPDGRLQAIVRDATERAQVAAALRESEERFRDLADNIPQLAWIADPGTQGQVLWFNRNWYEYTGTTLEKMRGSGWHAVQHPEHAERVIRKFTQHVADARDWEDTFPLRGKDGQYRWFLSRMKVIRDETGSVVRIFGTNTDITEQRKMEDELRILASEMAEVDRRKNEFLAMLAHELRNPLAPIRNAAQLLRRAPGNAQSVEAASSMIERQANHLVRLVDDLLDVSRISRGKIELRRERMELSSIVQQAVEATQPLYKSMGHELKLTLASHPIHLLADATRLGQVIGNLLNNAGKFTPKGGRIELTTAQQDGQAVIRVRDNGIGIASDQVGRIFDMFVQVDASLERSATGLGIGLTLVKTLVELHGGTVEARSAGLNQGTEFVLRLPIEAELTQPSSTPKIDEPQPPAAQRILVVDDNQDSATSLAALLQMTGNETQAVFNGLEALETMSTFRPDVVLLDIGLPGLNGYEVARRIRDRWGDSTMLVALTGWGQEEDRRKSREAGFDGHLVKPVDYAGLAKLIASRSAERLAG